MLAATCAAIPISVPLLLSSPLSQALAQAAAPAPQPGSRSSVVGVPSDDPVMAQAIVKATASLPDFFKRLAQPGPGEDGFAVKIYYPTATGGGEHIWANNVTFDGTSVTATISNEPLHIPDVKLGQKVTVGVDRITDWMYILDRKIHGGQTIRAVLPRMEAAEAAPLRAMLAPE